MSNVPANRDEFLVRDEGELYVRGRQIQLSPQCKVCRLIPNLTSLGYSQEQAEQAEKDLYRQIYTLYSPKEIAEWLQDSYSFQIEHDSVYRHIKHHCPDPALIMFKRLEKYRPVQAQHKFIDKMMDVMRATILKYQDDLAQGLVEVKPSDVTRMAEAYKDWQEDLQESHVNQMMEALKSTVDKVIADPDTKQEFEEVMRQELEKYE